MQCAWSVHKRRDVCMHTVFQVSPDRNPTLRSNTPATQGEHTLPWSLQESLFFPFDQFREVLDSERSKTDASATLGTDSLMYQVSSSMHGTK